MSGDGPQLPIARLEMRAAVIALVTVATLMAMPAAGDARTDSDVWWPNNVLDNRHHPLEHLDRDDFRINEVFPVKHRCTEVPVLIHAQRRTVERMIESCDALKWTADRFHVLMQTNPGDAVAAVNVYGHLTTVMEMFVLDRDDPQHRNYLKEFWDKDFAGQYFGGIVVVSETEDGLTILPYEVHEYVHHLQYDFASPWIQSRLPIWIEGFATFIQTDYVHSVLRNEWYGPSWTFRFAGWEFIEEYVVRQRLPESLPNLTAFLDRDGDQWQDLLQEYSQVWIEYYWGAWVFRFLAEMHHAELSNLREIFEGEPTRGLWLDTGPRVHDLIVRLNDDWHDWHESLAMFSVADAPGAIVLVRGEGGVSIDLRYFFRTINALTFDVSPIRGLSTNDNPPYDDTPPNVHVSQKKMDLIPNSLGTWEFTITATNIDGKSAELPFTMIVVERLKASEIAIRDPLSTEEGRTAVNLSHYFSGPEDITFMAESANTEVVTAVVTMEGRLVVTAISPGEAEITVRAIAGPQSAERTFTIIVTDECPPWVCRGFFSGWRNLLLQ